MLPAKKRIEFKGFINEDTPVLLKIEHEKYDTGKISCDVHLLSEEIKDYSRFRNLASDSIFGNLIIKSVENKREQILLKGSGYGKFNGKKAELGIFGYEYNITEDLIENPKELFAQVELTPSGILGKWGSRVQNSNGNIELENGYPEEIEWKSSIGTVQARINYDYEDHLVYDNKATIQIERPILFYKINVTKGLSPEKIRNFIIEDINDICSILSLCYRKSVSWYEISFMIISNDDETQIAWPLIRREVYSKNYSDDNEELVNHRGLKNDGLYKMVSSLRDSPMSESIRRSITFLSSADADHTIEVKYFLCMISLESFCNGYFESHTKEARIPSSKWKKIEAAIRRALNELSETPGYFSVIEAVKNKLPELKNITTLDKIIHSCEHFNPQKDDLWNLEAFEEGLSKALQMRNQLFHRAHCDEPAELHGNYLRIKILTERLILKALAWPDKKIWRWYDQKLKWINMPKPIPK